MNDRRPGTSKKPRCDNCGSDRPHGPCWYENAIYLACSSECAGELNKKHGQSYAVIGVVTPSERP